MPAILWKQKIWVWLYGELCLKQYNIGQVLFILAVVAVDLEMKDDDEDDGGINPITAFTKLDTW